MSKTGQAQAVVVEFDFSLRWERMGDRQRLVLVTTHSNLDVAEGGQEDTMEPDNPYYIGKRDRQLTRIQSEDKTFIEKECKRLVPKLAAAVRQVLADEL